jgi:hypothetical protein
MKKQLVYKGNCFCLSKYNSERFCKDVRYQIFGKNLFYKGEGTLKRNHTSLKEINKCLATDFKYIKEESSKRPKIP